MKPILSLVALTAAFAAAGCDVKMNSNAAAVAEINANAGASTWPEPQVFEFPTRAAGKWRTVSTLKGDADRKTTTNCHRFDQRIDEALQFTPIDALRNCATSMHWSSKKLIVEHTCNNGSQKVDARTTVHGNFKTSYTMETMVNFRPAFRGDSHASIITTAERIGDC
jgi:hypothetical protein